MVWNDTNAERERRKLVREWLTRKRSVVDLASAYDVDERTVHRTIKRFKEGGWEGLSERSRARHTQDATPQRLVNAIVDARRAHPNWGARTLRFLLLQDQPDVAWPAPSTIGSILDRAGLIPPRARRRRGTTNAAPCVEAAAPNDSWSMDFKGQFRTRDAVWCYPLTVLDNYSRYFLHCKALAAPTFKTTWRELVVCFEEHGLPTAIRSDNGTPFAGNGLTRMSKLAVRLIKLGVLPDYTAPASPQQNGRLERLHRTLKQETASPPAGDRAAQQRRFNSFLDEYNAIRPHQALGGKVPADAHVPSRRKMPKTLPDVVYDEGVVTRRIRTDGSFKWKAETVFLAEPLIDEQVAFVPIEDGIYMVRFSSYPLAVFDERTKKLFPAGSKPTKGAEG